jgi:hypothetical protein
MSSNPSLVLRGIVFPEFCFSRPVEFPTAVTRKSPTVWGRIMDHHKSE